MSFLQSDERGEERNGQKQDAKVLLERMYRSHCDHGGGEIIKDWDFCVLNEHGGLGVLIEVGTSTCATLWRLFLDNWQLSFSRFTL